MPVILELNIHTHTILLTFVTTKSNIMYHVSACTLLRIHFLLSIINEYIIYVIRFLVIKFTNPWNQLSISLNILDTHKQPHYL